MIFLKAYIISCAVKWHLEELGIEEPVTQFTLNVVISVFLIMILD